MDMVRSMMSYSDLPNSFWGHALETAAYILNLVPSKSVPTTMDWAQTQFKACSDLG